MANIRNNSVRGFVLLDVMLGMLILTIALLALGGLSYQSGRALFFTDDRTVAYNWAEQRMEFLKSDQNWRAAFAANSTQPSDTTFNATPPLPGFTETTAVAWANISSWPSGWNVTPAVGKTTLLNGINTHLISVTVTVNWTQNGVKQQIQLWTLVDYGE